MKRQTADSALSSFVPTEEINHHKHLTNLPFHFYKGLNNVCLMSQNSCLNRSTHCACWVYMLTDMGQYKKKFSEHNAEKNA